MRTVWSFWSKPHRQLLERGWAAEKYHLFAWILSVLTAKRHGQSTVLVTDAVGRSVLVDGLGLPFDVVSTELDALSIHRPDVWMLGKLHAYRMQTEPFVHVDTDVFLWQRLPDSVTGAPVFAQNPEIIDLADDGYYRPDDLDQVLLATRGWRPDAWAWALEKRLGLALNCGIFGGNDLGFIQRYANNAIQFIEHPSNQTAWSIVGPLADENIVFEQYMLGAHVAYEQTHPIAGQAAIAPSYLFESLQDAFNPARAKELGYTHLIGDAKRSPEMLTRLERRVARDYPKYYERCLRLLTHWKGW